MTHAPALRAIGLALTAARSNAAHTGKEPWPGHKAQTEQIIQSLEASARLLVNDAKNAAAGGGNVRREVRETR